ncbi:Myosin heavy chain, fast skeletal muscle [Labeo rohita]|uniref:Myosin heavy chain, fast skeletal muscle n=1 Tax=Labeo rohita TaxID=84645 RepID=A0ABQ8LIW9_LABRO|nr:Myosin heavy chain, fast skeletal muscle [Labeo rohita]
MMNYGKMKEDVEKALARRRRLKRKWYHSCKRKMTLTSSSSCEYYRVYSSHRRCEGLTKNKFQLEAKLKETTERMEDEKEINAELTAKERKLKDEYSEKILMNWSSPWQKWRRRNIQQKIRNIEISQLLSKIEDEQFLGSQLQKKIKELQKQRPDPSRELEEISERLEKTGGATAAQIEMNKKHKKNVTRLQDLVDKLQLEVKACKCQAEEAEKQRTTHLSRYRKVHNELEEAESQET